MILKVTLKMTLGSFFKNHEHSTHLLKHLTFIILILSVEKTAFFFFKGKIELLFLLQVDFAINASTKKSTYNFWTQVKF